MILFLVFGLALLLPGAFYTVLVIQSRNPKNLVATTGKLTRQTGYKNYRLKNRTVPNATTCTYMYTANGKPYFLRKVQLTHPRLLRKCVDILYLRSFPRCAYEGHFSGISETILAFSLIIMGLLCIVLYLVFA